MPLSDSPFTAFAITQPLDLTPLINRATPGKKRTIIENYFANRLLYPESVASTKIELDLDVELFNYLLSINQTKFFNSTTNQLTIPGEFSFYFHPTSFLIELFIKAFSLPEVAKLKVKYADGSQTTGSIFTPSEGHQSILKINSKPVTITPDKINTILLPEKNALIEYNNHDYAVSGGQMGLIVNLSKT